MDGGGSFISRRWDFLQYGHKISVGYISEQPLETLAMPYTVCPYSETASITMRDEIQG